MTDPLRVYADASPPEDDYYYDYAIIQESFGSNNNTARSTAEGGTTPIDARGDDDDDDDNTKIDIYSQVPDDHKHLVKPALVGGAVFGMLLGGPIVSVLLGFGSAYSVRKQDAAIGDIARGVGEITEQVQHKAVEVETKHQYCHRIRSSVENYCKEQPDDSWVNRTKSVIASAWSSTVKYTHENQLIERGVEGTGRGIEYLSNVFSSSSSSPSKSVSTE
jgi:hypothetical protein